jgi:hypothetical protein
MYKCSECGLVFEDARHWEEHHEFWGASCSEHWSGCPDCSGGFEEAYECKICGEYHTEEELKGGVCGACISRYGNFKTCFEIGKNNPDTIKINSLLMSYFSESEIEDILKKIIIEQGLDKDCSDFINNDISWFGEELAKEVLR